MSFQTLNLLIHRIKTPKQVRVLLEAVFLMHVLHLELTEMPLLVKQQDINYFVRKRKQYTKPKLGENGCVSTKGECSGKKIVQLEKQRGSIAHLSNCSPIYSGFCFKEGLKLLSLSPLPMVIHS